MKRPEENLLQLNIGRRGLLRWMGVGAGMALIPLSACSSSPSGYGYKFLTADEVAALDSLADGIFPPDQDPGGKALGTSQFIDRMLSAFEGGGPIWAGGPYSGRTPFPAADGSPSTSYPPDDFATALPMDRVHSLYWKYLIYGSSTQPGPNDALDGPFAGYQTIIRDGLANAESVAQAKFNLALEKLEPENAQTVVQLLLADTTNGGKPFAELLLTLTAQACFSAPEYGGNANTGGWKIAHYEGDRQPLGYSWYNPATDGYREDPTYPVSTANPGTDPDPMDADTETFVQLAAATQT